MEIFKEIYNLCGTPIVEAVSHNVDAGRTNEHGREDEGEKVRCAFSDRNLHSRMPLDPTHARLKLLHACDQWHSSRVFTPLTG
jgi:hypothetical protein